MEGLRSACLKVRKATEQARGDQVRPQARLDEVSQGRNSNKLLAIKEGQLLFRGGQGSGIRARWKAKLQFPAESTRCRAWHRSERDQHEEEKEEKEKEKKEKRRKRKEREKRERREEKKRKKEKPKKKEKKREREKKKRRKRERERKRKKEKERGRKRKKEKKRMSSPAKSLCLMEPAETAEKKRSPA